MIYAINYADNRYKKAQKLNSQTALLHGVDRVVEYSPQDMDVSFYNSNKKILMCQRGNGYWLWKPYYINRTLMGMNDGDYLVYADSGSYYVNDVNLLIKCMKKEGSDIMVFSLGNRNLERIWSKRDAFIIMGCDTKEYTDTPQRLATFIVVKKTEFSCTFINEWLSYAQDMRVITDQQNCMGKENYVDFIENRHDQTVLSLLSKKYRLKCFRDPSISSAINQEEISKRSSYPQIFELHRIGNIGSIKSLEDIHNERLKELLGIWEKNEKIIIYGAGKRAEKIIAFAEKRNFTVDACIVSDDQICNERIRDGIPIYHFSECPYSFKENIIINTLNIDDVISRLKKYECAFLCIDKEMWNSLNFFERQDSYSVEY